MNSIGKTNALLHQIEDLKVQLAAAKEATQEAETQRDMEHCECDIALARVAELEGYLAKTGPRLNRVIEEKAAARAALAGKETP